MIEANTKIGDGTSIGNFTTIKAGTTIGKDCRIFHNCSVGEIPQDLKFKGEDSTVKIGDRVTLRESVTVNRGTAARGETELGNDILLMAYVHIAHDCVVGDHVIMANLTTLGGHVTVEEWAFLGGCVLVHQFCHVGAHAFVGAGFRAVQDVPPFVMAAGEPLKFGGINHVGLKRRGFRKETREAIKKAYRWVYRSNESRSDVLLKIRAELEEFPEAIKVADFIESSERGII